ncbi:HAD family phosphatase [Chryseobacterium sp. BIGb0232]|uniref:HAD family hydrolase n=1 Tax=Chryseobacterium sp. BIGb0232 TaxID=2940598 RepID=UPI000FB66A32|nr:HAD family phosphatase [Chryseobacterium sp. BIGb0232]MCS4300959.1 HAD superfamily hydrolase (TIGR01490 family) [Chryseobacterium sp. BIGb0232]ROS20175.1 HAD superfamily hydrolase (TIGR01490 family) [Chryseobacterium nakagawai]
MKNLPKNLHAVYFDVDGTLTKSNIVEPLLYIKKQVMSPFRYSLWKAGLPFRFIYWTFLDKIDREKATASIYRQYKNISVETMDSLKYQCYQEKYQKKLFPKALEAINTFKGQGTRMVLVSGSLDIFLQLLAEELEAELISSRLETKNGIYTGAMEGRAVSGKRKAELIRQHAHRNQFTLENCASFGDSGDDIAMLASVQYPVAVNPDKKLASLAQKNNWELLIWS